MTGRPRRQRTAAILAVLVFLLSACGDDGESGNDDGTTADDATVALRVGRFDFEESRVLAELYAQALGAAGVPVRRVEVDGPREIMAPALEQGQVDLLPEYLGTATGYYGFDQPAPARATVTNLRALLEPRGLAALSPSKAQNTNAFAVLASSGLGPKISDLAEVASNLRFGGLAECRDRPLCLVGLESTYGLRFAEFIPQPSLAITAEALRRGEIDVGLMFATNAEVTDDFILLEDDLGLQPAENVVPVIRFDALSRWGEANVTTTLDAVSAALTTTELRALNRRAAREDVEVIVAEWLAAQEIGA